MQYDQRFYDDLWEGGRQAAQLVLPAVLAAVSPTTIVDVGCGGGAWLSVAADLGVNDLTGVDGASSLQAVARFDGFDFVETDLDQPFAMSRTFDLAISIEVAEHLPPPRAGSFVADLTRLAPVVLFSAAYPGQGGTGHVNEQWPSYWAAKFAAVGYAPFEVCRPTYWNDSSVPMAVRTNMLLYANASASSTLASHLNVPTLLDVVHPTLWDGVRSQHRRMPHRLAALILRATDRARMFTPRRVSRD
jgi:SAM-dependent methyltransferase